MIAILPDGLRQPLGNPSDHRDLVAELDHDRAEVEHDRATLGLDERRVVVQQPHQLALRPGRHLHPHGLHARAFERRIRCPVGARAGETGQNRCESLLRGRQTLRDRRLHVDVLEQHVDRLCGNLCSDLVVLDHVARDRLEPVLVQGRVLDVERDHPDEREQDRDDGEYAGADDAGQRRPARLRDLWPRSSRGAHLLTSREEVDADQGDGADRAQDEHGDDACVQTEERSHDE